MSALPYNFPGHTEFSQAICADLGIPGLENKLNSLKPFATIMMLVGQACGHLDLSTDGRKAIIEAARKEVTILNAAVRTAEAVLAHVSEVIESTPAESTKDAPANPPADKDADTRAKGQRR